MMMQSSLPALGQGRHAVHLVCGVVGSAIHATVAGMQCLSTPMTAADNMIL